MSEYWDGATGRLSVTLHGTVTFGQDPITLEVTCMPHGVGRLANRPITADRLTTEILSKQL